MLKYNELRVVAGAQEGAMQNRRAAQHHIPRTGEKERRRHPVQVRIKRRKYRILQIGCAGVTRHARMWRMQRPPQADHRVYGSGKTRKLYQLELEIIGS
jgi:hypothetical protein